MTVICAACNYKAPSERGLSLHRRHCTKTHQRSRLVFGHRRDQKTASKLARSGSGDDVTVERQRVRDTIDQNDTLHDEWHGFEEPAAISEPTTPADVPSYSRAGRKRKAPRMYHDYLPSSLAGLPIHIPRPIRPLPPLPPQRLPAKDPLPAAPSADPPPIFFETDQNFFGLYRQYTRKPAHDPEDESNLDAKCDAPGLSRTRTTTATARIARQPTLQDHPDIDPLTYPFDNSTIMDLVHWRYSQTNITSCAAINALATDVLLQPDFSPDHVVGLHMQRELKILDQYGNSGSPFAADDGWREATVKIKLPKESFAHDSEDSAPEIEVSGVQYRPILEVLKAVYQDPQAAQFHFTPFKMFWQADAPADKDPPPPERVYSEVYNSDAMLEEDCRIQEVPRHPEDPPDLEYAIAPIMMWSDSTHLAQFGTSSLWPMYLLAGNQSKYSRAKPSANAAQHVAYIPSIPDTIQDVYNLIYGIAATAAVLTFCKRELFQAIWLLLLDDTFIHAYVHGFVILCGDGIMRRMFPRFLTYSADYPEKVLIACIRFLARCPCPTCLVTKDKIERLGTKSDMRQRDKWPRLDTSALREKIRRTREWIFERGYPLTSKHLANVLDDHSLTPTLSAFSRKLGHLGFNHYAMLVPDLMHEFELGVWKAVLIHLIRILHAAGEDKIQEFNKRFRQVPPFGRSAIRRFSNNVSSMKKLAARDFEDIVFCQFFEGLLPDNDNTVVMDLLYELVSWHAYAKLRLHTESTLKALEHATTTLGAALRKFKKTTCQHYTTFELPKEEAARGRRKAREAQKAKKSNTVKSKGKATSSRGATRKEFNLCTAKLHALGHYVSAIVKFGTTDNYTTQIGELEHRIVKRYYARTNKNKFARQIAKEQRRATLIRAIIRRARAARARMSESQTTKKSTKQTVAEDDAWEKRVTTAVEEASVVRVSPRVHYHVSRKAKVYDMLQWVTEHKGDAAVKDFIPKLTDHVLTRLGGQEFDGEEPTYSSEERVKLRFVRNKLYQHKKLQINYTTYDMRRAQDSINPRTRSDVMLLAHEDDNDYPYWYARVVGVFHVNVVHELRPRQWSEEQQVDFLLVRWYGRDLTVGGRFHNKRLPLVGFMPADEEGAFSFLDPAVVIRAIHIIPAFAYGRTTILMGPSIARRADEHDEDWDHYYVNIFGDRDLFMHHRGGGVGHKGKVGYATSWEQEGVRSDPEEEDEDDEDSMWHKGEEDGDKDQDTDEEDEEEEYEEEGPDAGEEDYDYNAGDPEDEVTSDNEEGNVEESDDEPVEPTRDEDEGECEADDGGENSEDDEYAPLGFDVL